ncbi:glutamate receptor 4-like [Amphibalanus amphitrite]|uniref:glutamate receptor 4-like n=1 Tax=Amphibalanus amphitrite TaxID=1232801 RepID=UPI001C9048A2|nr:glutamate receptor 4-like [Amphibalanus amphitrite]
MSSAGALRQAGLPWSSKLPETPENLTSQDPLRVVAFDDPPYVSVHHRPDGSVSFSGYLFQLWQIIADELDLSYQLVAIPQDSGYGSMDENGTWTGMVGELTYGRADLALTWLNGRPDRASVVDLIDAVPVERERYTFYLRQGARLVPKVTPTMLSSIFRPLHLHVWLLLLAALLVLAAALRLSSRYDGESSGPTVEDRRAREHLGWGSCLFSVFMSMVGQGWSVTPRSNSGRVVTSVTWMLGMLINISYTANLISHLAVTTVDRPISSLQEFAEQPDWLLAVEAGTGIINDWKSSDSALEQGLFRRVISGEGLLRLDGTRESASRAIQPRVLAYIDLHRLTYALGSEACAVVPLLDRMPSYRSTYLAMAKGRPRLKRAINRVMLRMDQSGTLDRLKSMWLRAGRGTCQPSGGVKALAFGDMLPVLLLIPIAVFFSAVIVVLEVIWHKRYVFNCSSPKPLRNNFIWYK